MAKTTALERYKKASAKYKTNKKKLLIAKERLAKARTDKQKATALNKIQLYTNRMNKASASMAKNRATIFKNAERKAKAARRKYKKLNNYKRNLLNPERLLKKEINKAKARAKQIIKNLPDEIRLMDVLKDLNEVEGLAITEEKYLTKSGKEKTRMVMSIADDANPLAIADTVKDLLPSIQRQASNIQKEAIKQGKTLSRREAIEEAVSKYQVDYYSKDLWKEYADMKKIADKGDLIDMKRTSWYKWMRNQGGYYKDHEKFDTNPTDWKATSDTMKLARSSISEMYDRGVALQEKKKQAILSGTDLF